MAETGLRGVFPVLPAVFRSDGSIDEAGMADVTEYAVAAGVAGVVFPGLASEYDLLSAEERSVLTAIVGAQLAGRAAFVVGASAADPRDAVRHAREGAAAGASVAMVMTPHALGTDMRAMTDFYRDVADQSGLAVMLQNAPAPMGLGLSIGDVAALVNAVPRISFIKEETQPSGQRISQLQQLLGEKVAAVFGGAGARYVIDELNRGAGGTMPAAEISELHVAMVARFDGGDERGARDLFERTLPLLSMQAIFRWRLTKEVLHQRGIIANPYVRAPGPELDTHDHKELNQLLARMADLLTEFGAAPVQQAAQ